MASVLRSIRLVPPRLTRSAKTHMDKSKVGIEEMRAYRENNIYRFEWNASTTLKFVFFTVFPFIGLYQLSKSRLEYCDKINNRYTKYI